MTYTLTKTMKRLNHILGEIDAVYHEIALKLGLSDSALAILYAILCSGSDSYPLKDICRCSGLSKQTVNSAIRKLEAEGILYLEPATAKSKNVCLTEAGKRLAGETAGRVIRTENEIFDSWPQKDVDQYLRLTEAYLLSIRDKAKYFTGETHV